MKGENEINLSSVETRKVLEENKKLLLEKTRLEKEIRNLRERLTFDSITGLLRTQDEGRRKILEKIEAAHSQHKRIGLIRFDLNNLKGWNEEFGHDETDEILGDLGRELGDWARKREGLAMRFHYKGDEFGALLIAASKDELSQVAQELNTLSVKSPKGMVVCSFTLGIVHENEPEVKREIDQLDEEEDGLSDDGRLFTALSRVADRREREEEKRKGKR